MAASLLGAAATAAVPDNARNGAAEHLRTVDDAACRTDPAAAAVLLKQQTPPPVRPAAAAAVGVALTSAALDRTGAGPANPCMAGGTRGRFAVYATAHLLGAARSGTGPRGRALPGAVLLAQSGAL